ncbi:HD domain-containing protein [Gluconacetobacter entanii]|uniref:HD domain-containing protein n=1 Tax=Gluconacetobacter entanii TaxID=108528 RepID=UPI001C932022|nr:HD domain-containing protein [Gluconacetobacter entanii]MBY4641729.1 HD domain-containing protein [Gluconacetobacter entanii]MCW4579444.1 HD domain-containing protein [Gluconacetobacter entanii]MCW4582805.1 HD domain-containing protein [Gluconacetobacter entanii]MCW4586246.1 HD domain-containing protein [Gluconacetobacter entanii]
MDLTSRAAAFAAVAHGKINQRRKYTDEPYIVHPWRVARTVRQAGARDEVVAAAWLHDVVEDTPVTLVEIEAEFGPDVAALVEMVTDVSRPEDGNRKARKALDRAHLARASAEGQTIKLADLIDNTETIVEHAPGFARVYLPEKRELLRVLTAGDATLHRRAAALAERGMELLQSPVP